MNDDEGITEDPHLLAIAEAVADGLPVDWDGEDGSPEKDLLKSRLRFLQVVADAHRRVLVAEGEDTPLDR